MPIVAFGLGSLIIFDVLDQRHNNAQNIRAKKKLKISNLARYICFRNFGFEVNPPSEVLRVPCRRWLVDDRGFTLLPVHKIATMLPVLYVSAGALLQDPYPIRRSLPAGCRLPVNWCNAQGQQLLGIVWYGNGMDGESPDTRARVRPRPYLGW